VCQGLLRGCPYFEHAHTFEGLVAFEAMRGELVALVFDRGDRLLDDDVTCPCTGVAGTVR
jgi:hypothetical protein